MSDTGIGIPGSGSFADLFSQGPPTVGPQVREPIGGFTPPDDTSVVRRPQDDVPFGRLRSQGAFGQPPSTAPTDDLRTIYYAGAEYDILRGLTTEDRVRLQQQLVALGLANNVVYGEIDGGETGTGGTLGAMRALLAMANRAGEEWQSTLGRIATNPEMQAQAGGLVGSDRQPYMAPDYASMAQEVKNVFRKRLGREPDQAEMAELVGEIQGWDRQSFDAGTQPDIGPDGLPAAEGTRVDPLARFQEEFDRRYSGELDFIEDKASAVVARESVEQSTALASSMARGNF